MTSASAALTRSRSAGRRPRRRPVAAVAATGFLFVSSFQVALALGAPLGAAAWGGAHAGQLPAELRVASAFSATFWFVAASVVLSRGGFARVPISGTVSRRGTRLLVALLAVGALMNAASSSPWERFIWAPVTLALMGLCYALARDAAGAGAPVAPALAS